MMAAITPVRDPGTLSSKMKQWGSSDHHATDQVHQRQQSSSHIRSKPGRFSNSRHRPRRNTSPSVMDKHPKITAKVDAAFLNACKNTDLLMLKTAICQNINPETVNQQDVSGKTGLNYVCCNGNLEMLRMLCTVPNIDANLADNEGNTPLMIAAQAGHVDILATLLKQYKETLILDQRNLMGFTSLMKASLQGRIKCVKLLLHSGASPWLIDYGRGYYALQWAKYCGRHSCAEVIERYLKTTNQKQPPVMRKKNVKQKNLGSKSSSEPDLINAVTEDGAKDNLENLIDKEQNFNQCPVENSNLHDQKSWLKRGFKKAFQRKSADMKVIGNITGVGMVAAASGGMISNTNSGDGDPSCSSKNDQKTGSKQIPKVHVTNSY